MAQWLALLALLLLVGGCQSSSQPTTIDSVRSSYFDGQQPSVASQVAAAPGGGTDRISAAPKALSPGTRDQAKTGAEPAKQPGAPPYKASVAAYIKRYAVDSNPLKLAKIGTPFQGSVNGQTGSVVCVELGGLRSNRTAYLLKDDAVVDSEFGAPSCRDKQLEPWNNAGA